MLSRLWLSLFVLGLLGGCVTAWQGQTQVFAAMVQALTVSAETSVHIGLTLAGVMAFWLGLFKVAESAGWVDGLARCLSPVLRRLMPDVPAGHPALGAMSMNLAANLLGLDNAATPFGLRAMRELQSLNASEDQVSNAQIMFLMLNCNALCLLPVSIFAYRAQAGSLDPALVFLPILISSLMALLLALSLTMLIQRIRPDRVLVAGVMLLLLILIGLGVLHHELTVATLSRLSSVVGNALVLVVIVGILLTGFWRHTDIYTDFIQGAAEGAQVALSIFPYLVAMLSALAVLRAGGMMDVLLHFFERGWSVLGGDTAFIPALPSMLMKPFSGSAARGMLLDVIHHEGVDSFSARVAAVVQGSTETTFYVVTVYLGSVSLRDERYALTLGLLTELMGAGVAVLVGYAFFPSS
ncbi:MAG: hypothetical protein HKM02_03725 [Pseudomonadales bacterium]|nr:hypothetical protein [Pseudomonadales bacterium]